MRPVRRTRLAPRREEEEEEDDDGEGAAPLGTASLLAARAHTVATTCKQAHVRT